MRRMTRRENCAAYGHRGDAVRIPYYTNGSDTEECDEDGYLTGRLLRQYKITCHVCGEVTRTTIPIERGER